MPRFTLLPLLAAAALAVPAQAAPYRPLDLTASDRATPAAERTQYAVLGTTHLAELPKDQRPDLSALIERLARWHPDAITVEGLSGPQCELLLRYKANYPDVAEQYCWDAADMEKESGVSLVRAEAELPQALAAVAASPGPQARRHLAMLFLSANDRGSALVQWLRLPAAERKADGPLTPALVELLEKLRTGRNEIYALAAPLAARLGHDRLWPTDDHTADALTAGAGKEFEAAMMQIWDNPGARALRPQMEAQAKTMTDAAGVLAYYRRANSTTALRQQLDVDFLAALKDKSPQHWGRRYVAWWEVRNLRMVAAIRAAGGAQPGSRVLSIVGGSHKPYFERYLAQSHDATVVDVLGLLK